MKRLTVMSMMLLVTAVLGGCSGSYNSSAYLKEDNEQIEIEYTVEGEGISGAITVDTDGTTSNQADADEMGMVEEAPDTAMKAGAVVTYEQISEYMSFGEDPIVYAIKTGEEYQVIYCQQSDFEQQSARMLHEDGCVGYISLLDVTISADSQLVNFGDEYGPSLYSVANYQYAFTIPFSGNSLPNSFRAYIDNQIEKRNYTNSLLEGDMGVGEFEDLDITEVDGIAVYDPSIQSRMIPVSYVGSCVSPTVLLSNEETVKLGGFEGTVFCEQVFNCGYYCEFEDKLAYEQVPTKLGYFISIGELGMASLQDGKTYFVRGVSGGDCLITVAMQ